jgi:hypothetical protein
MVEFILGMSAAFVGLYILDVLLQMFAERRRPWRKDPPK